MADNIIKTPISDRLLRDEDDAVPWANKEAIPFLREVRAAINGHDTVSDYDVTSSATSLTIDDEVIVIYTGSGTDTFALPSVAALGAGKFRPLFIVNNGTKTLTVAAHAGETVNGVASTTLANAAAMALFGDGDTKWRTLGGAFRATSLSLSGSLTVAGAASVTGRLTVNGDQVRMSTVTQLVASGAVSGAPVTAVLVGDLRQMAFGTSHQVIIGNRTFDGGLSIGTASADLMGFWGATPGAQPAAVADATGAGDVVAQLNALLARLRSRGVIAT